MNLLIVTGPVDSGKTRKAEELAREFRSGGKKVGGVLSLAEYSGGRKTGYRVLDLAGGESELLLAENFAGPGFGRKRFRFSSAGFAFASLALSRAMEEGADAIFLDEIGRVELEGRGFAPDLDRLLAGYEGTLILVVRDSLLEEAKKAFKLPKDFGTIRVGE